MVWDKMVAIFGIDYNSSEFNSYLWRKGPKPVVCWELFTEIQEKIGERGFQVSNPLIQLMSVNLSLFEKL